MKCFVLKLKNAAISDETLNEAADWLSRRDRGFSSDEQAGFDAWLSADPSQARAMAEVGAAWKFLLRPRESGRAALVEQEIDALRRRRLRRRRFGAAVFTSLAAAAAVVFLLRANFDHHLPRTDVVTVARLPHPELRTLSDGSVVELNATAEIAVDFSAARRDVRLVRGEAHFSVAKDASRPFVVSAGGVQVIK